MTHAAIPAMHAPLRSVARRLRRAGPSLVYHPREAAPRTGPMDAHRSASILGWLIDRRIVRASDVTAPPAAPLRELRLVHDREYLERVDDRQYLERVFPGLPESLEANELIHWQRRMVGGTALAAREAVGQKTHRPVVHLGGGLHHARAAGGGGYCLFNDVAVAIADLREDGWTGRALVIDLDVHHGDGTRTIFAGDPSVFTFSVHAEHWDTSPAVADLSIALGTGVEDELYLQVLSDRLPSVISGFDPDLVFVIGGTDVAFDDPIGSWRITADGILRRDQFVLEQVGKRPLVWTLAGGYGPEAWRYTARTLGWMFGGRDEPIDSTAQKALAAFRKIRQSITPAELTSEDDHELSLNDVLLDLSPDHRHRWFLDLYSPYGIELALDRYGILEKLRDRGYDRIRVELDLDHGTGQRLRLVTADESRDLLIELVARIDRSHAPHRLLWIEWLLMQDPRSTSTRPRLPGQEAPGLGCSLDILGLLVMAAERLELDGVGFNPTRFHVAWMVRGTAEFLDSKDRIQFDNRREAFGRRPLPEAAERLRDWSPGPMVLPISARLKEALRAQ